MSSIFDAMNFQHFLEMLEIMLQHFRKMLEIHCIKDARNQKSTFDLSLAQEISLGLIRALRKVVPSTLKS